MKMAKHTAGPWAVQGRVSLSDCRSVVYRQAQDGQPSEDIALVGAISPSEQEANAHLISAAPELLDALITLEEASEHGSVEEQEYAAKKARAAIAKATAI